MSKADCETVFSRYISRANVNKGDMILTLAEVTKCIKECELASYSTTLDTVWMASAKKKYPSNKVPPSYAAGELIDKLAEYDVTHVSKGKNGDATAVAAIIRGKIAAKVGVEKKKAAVDSTTARLTNVAGFTGSHKERFDSEGKGKGIEGRVERADDSGYVGNYKGKDTYDKKH